MQRKDIEKFAFLYLCGEKDRNILLKKQEMSISDLDRLTYIADFLNLKYYNLEIWNQFSGQFQEQFNRLQKFIEESYDDEPYGEIECNYQQVDKWLMDFCENVPDLQSREELKQIMKQMYMEKNIEYPTEADTE